MVAASAYADTADGKLGKGGGTAAPPEAHDTFSIMDPEEEAVTFRWVPAECNIPEGEHVSRRTAGMAGFRWSCCRDASYLDCMCELPRTLMLESIAQAGARRRRQRA